MSAPVTKIRIGISACLLGERVRFDGGHKKDEFLTRQLGKYVEWVPVCPEVEMGLGVPRESLRLVSNGPDVRLVAPRSGQDHTVRMTNWLDAKAPALSSENLCGFILKRSSPSCGLERVKVYSEAGIPFRQGRGVFSSGLADRFPDLPLEEEGRLHDPRLRENFISRVFCYKRWQELQESGLTRSKIMGFHARHKFRLMAHHQAGARRIGKLLGEAPPSTAPAELAHAYFGAFSEVMRHTPTRRNHTNVLQHLAGYFSRQLDTEDREELQDVIQDYRKEYLPLIVPVTLIRHYVRKFRIPYLLDQLYLDPHPDELLLLNNL